MGKIKAVLFDMDGLMIDSEPFHYQAFNEVIEKYGKHLTQEENNQRYIGLSDEDEARDMVVRFNLPISSQELVQQKQVILRQILKNQVSPQPGLLDLLKKLDDDGYKTAIASSSSLEVIKTIIDGLKISALIDEYASAQQVERGKPAPDIYLLAVKKLGVDPSECLVLEDAPRGVEAGKSAGMSVFAIPSSATKGEDFSMADKVLSSLSEVYSELKP